jgi:hypothetical protein
MPEICNPDAPIDDDCDGLVDDADPDVSPDSYLEWYADADADGYGSGLDFVYACSRPDGSAPNSDDCDDSDPTVGPPSLWYLDADRDGFGAGDPVEPTPTCESPDPLARPDWIGLDCGPSDPTVYPGAAEICEDEVDQDCDGEDMLCIAPNPECSAYVELDQDWRHVDQTGPVFCDDRELSLNQWFRFVGDAGTQMPEVAVPENYCSTHAPGWLDGVHPGVLGETADVRVCFHWVGAVCNWETVAQVTYCGGYDDFYVYFLPTLPFACSGVYCGE